jgi:hypothetical protein
MEEPGFALEEKALFIPLARRWFLSFQAGDKDTEYRAYGPRWNERTCRIGRAATLALGYGHPRLSRVVTGFEKLDWRDAPQAAKTIFPTARHIAAIKLAPQP